jgi:hypothetical protein
MFRNSCFLFLAVIVLSGCFDPNAASLRLRQGMTENEAIAAVGQPPTSAEVRVCGGQNSRWNCRILKFKAPGQSDEMIVYEAQSAGEWRVSSWSVL